MRSVNLPRSHPKEDDDVARLVCCPRVRPRRVFTDSADFFQKKYRYRTDRVSLDGNSLPLAFDVPADGISNTKRLELGHMSRVCSHCAGLHWSTEAFQPAMSSTVFEVCCKEGAVRLTAFTTSLIALRRLLESGGPRERRFRQNTRHYIAALSLTSLGHVADKSGDIAVRSQFVSDSCRD